MKRLAVLLAVLAAAVMWSPPAGAAPVPTLVVDPGYGPPLTTVKLTARSFCTTCGQVTISVASLTVDYATPNSSGGFVTFVRIPGSARPGPVTIAAAQAGMPTARTSYTVTIDQPAPTTYRPPSSIPAPGNLPPASNTTSTAAQGPAPTQIPGSSTASPAPSSANSSATAPGSTQATPSAGPASPVASKRSTSDLGWIVGLAAAVAAVGAAAAAWALRRRRSG